MSYSQQQRQIDIGIPRRLAIMDIETTSLDAMTGRVACIGLLFDNAVNLQPVLICEQDERKLLERFWASITENDLLIGHNILEFDLMYIRQRSWILGVKPPMALNLKKYYTDQVVDLMALWTNWSYKFKGAGLDNIANALGLGGKTGHGSEVAEMWAKGEYVKVMDYCMSDVWLTYQVYCKMHYREPLGVPIPKPVAPPPQRELVMVPVQQKGPEALMTLQAPIQTVSAPTVPQQPAYVPQSSNGNGRPREAIFYQQKGTEVILSGKGIFPAKKPLKEIYRAWGEKISAPEERPQRFVWHLRQEKFQDFASYCQNVGIPLQAMGDGATRIRKEA